MLLPELHRGTLLRRYKRFLADVRLDDGRELTAHCANPGRMTSCMEEGGTIWLSHSDNPKRKLRWSWEIAEVDGACIVVNTARGNAVVKEGLLGCFPGADSLRSEVKVGASRLDFAVEPGPIYVEVKSVTLKVDGDLGAFPDAPSVRALRHLEELQTLVEAGERAALLFVIARSDLARVRPADEVHPAYGEALRRAVEAGVEVLVRRTVIEGRRFTLGEPGELVLP